VALLGSGEKPMESTNSEKDDFQWAKNKHTNKQTNRQTNNMHLEC